MSAYIEDIYSMLFASCIKYEYLYYFRNVKGREGDLSDSEEVEAEEATAKDADQEDGPFKENQDVPDKESGEQNSN